MAKEVSRPDNIGKSVIGAAPPTATSPAAADTAALVTLFNQGRFADVVVAARELTRAHPRHAFGWKALGSALQQSGNNAEALVALRTAAQLVPRDAQAHTNLGETLRNLGRLAEAEESHRRALEIAPSLAAASANLGNVLCDLGRGAEAEAAFRRALQVNPDHFLACFNLGNLLREQGRLEEAIAALRSTLRINPSFARAHFSLANALKEDGERELACASYRQAIELSPEYAEAHCNLGVTQRELRQHAEAERSFRAALSFDPDSAPAHLNLGIALRELGRLEESERSLRQAIALDPLEAENHNNLAIALAAAGRMLDAEGSFRRALELRPEFAEALSNLGCLVRDFGRHAEAESLFRDALRIRPDFIEVQGNLIGAMNYTSHDSPECLDQARRFGRLVAAAARRRYSAWRCSDNPERLRVGLVSGDLREHVVAYFLESVVGCIDPARVELIAYSTNRQVDESTVRLRQRLAAWKSLAELDDAAAAAFIHADGVHVLLDLSGHTAHNRLPIFAWKPAPVQASWLGYFGTTGVEEIDYFVADPWTLPEANDGHFTETIWRLPDTRLCYTAPRFEIAAGELPALSDGHVTFGCFNNLSKMTDAVVAAWSEILAGVPRSRLLLKAGQLVDVGVRRLTLQRFAAQGVEEDRLILEGPSPRDEYLAAYHRVDIGLDPFPFTGGATTADALWMGVPVLTLAGQRLVARQGVGLAGNAGLADWIATDAGDYVRKAVVFAGDLGRLAELRSGLRARVLESPIFDAPRFARHFEVALHGMWLARGAGRMRGDGTQKLADGGDAKRPAAARGTGADARRPAAVSDAGELRALTELLDTRQFALAGVAARRFTERHPRSSAGWKALGTALQAENRLDDALVAMETAAALAPGDARLRTEVGSVLYGLGRLAEAEVAHMLAIDMDPGVWEAYGNLAIVLQDLGRFAEAEAGCRRALQLAPDSFRLHYNLGNIIRASGRLEEAEGCYRRALELFPGFAEGHANLGLVLSEQGRATEAEAAYRHALAAKPEDVYVLNNLGNVLFKAVGRLDEAERCYRRVLDLMPNLAETHCHLGLVLMAMGRRDDAEAGFRDALRIKPDMPEARINLAYCLLATGRYAEAWPHHEARFDPKRIDAAVEMPNLPFPRWQGENLQGKSILVWPEQGYGDCVQFIRYVPILKRMGATRVAVVSAAELLPLLGTVAGIDVLVTSGDAVPRCDFWTLLMSVPLHSGTTLANVPAILPYVHALPERRSTWRKRLPTRKGLTVGVAWKGNAGHKNDAHRSLPSLAVLAPLWSVAGVTFVSLQKGQGEDEVDIARETQPMAPLGAQLGDFGDTAAIVEQLDLVICVDTAVAHVAGALGTACWVMLPAFRMDWRWLADGNNSPWYPEVIRLFRQSVEGDWAGVVQSMTNALRERTVSQGGAQGS